MATDFSENRGKALLGGAKQWNVGNACGSCGSFWVETRTCHKKCLICKPVVRLIYLAGPLYAGDRIIREVRESTLSPSS